MAGGERPLFGVWTLTQSPGCLWSHRPTFRVSLQDVQFPSFYPTGTRAVTGRPVGGRDPGVRRPPGQNCPSLPAFDPFLGFSAAGWLLSAPGRSCLHLPPALSLLAFPSRPFPVCPCAHVKNKPPLLPSPVGFPREARLGPVCPLKADVCFVTRNDWAARSGCTGISPGGKEGLRGVPSSPPQCRLRAAGGCWRPRRPPWDAVPARSRGPAPGLKRVGSTLACALFRWVDAPSQAAAGVFWTPLSVWLEPRVFVCFCDWVLSCGLVLRSLVGQTLVWAARCLLAFLLLPLRQETLFSMARP